MLDGLYRGITIIERSFILIVCIMWIIERFPSSIKLNNFVKRFKTHFKKK